MELDRAHLERRGVPVAHQVANQAAVLADATGARAVGNPGRLHDRRIIPHVVDHPDEPVVQHGILTSQDGLEVRDDRPARGCIVPGGRSSHGSVFTGRAGRRVGAGSSGSPPAWQAGRRGNTPGGRETRRNPPRARCSANAIGCRRPPRCATPRVSCCRAWSRTAQNRMLHIRVDPDRLVFNTKTNGTWGDEEYFNKCGIGSAGKLLTLRVEARSDCFHIIINGKDTYDYKHRLPLTDVNMCVISTSDIKYYTVVF